MGARARCAGALAAAVVCAGIAAPRAFAGAVRGRSRSVLCANVAFVGAAPTMRAARMARAARCTTSHRFDIADEYPPIPTTGDFNGDGKSDVLVYAAGAREDRLWYSNGSGFRAGPTVTVNGVYFPFVGDFDGDGNDDVLWFPFGPERGETSVWYGKANGFRAGPALDAPKLIDFSSGDSYIPAVADFDNDGKSDIAWMNFAIEFPGAPAPHGSLIWYGRATGFHAAATTVPTPACLTVPFVTPADVGITVSVCAGTAADFNGDGRADLFFYRSGPQADAVMYSTGSGFHAGPTIAVSGFYEMFCGDFNGNGKTDVFWYAPGTDHDYLWYGRASGFRNGPEISVNGEYQPVSDDFNGDGKSDVVWYAPGSSRDYLRYGATSGFRNGPPVGINGFYLANTGDFNGDGKQDIVWFPRQRGARSHIWYGAASGFAVGTPVAL